MTRSVLLGDQRLGPDESKLNRCLHNECRIACKMLPVIKFRVELPFAHSRKITAAISASRGLITSRNEVYMILFRAPETEPRVTSIIRLLSPCRL